jgi:hypothetical protein
MIMETPTPESLSLVHRGTTNIERDPWRLAQIEKHARAFDVINEWHRDNHIGNIAHCHEQPCHAVAMAVFG